MAPHLFQRLIRRVNRLLLNHFPRKPEPGALVQRRWESSFSENGNRRRFEEEQGAGYSARYEQDRFVIDLKKPGIFAWSRERLYRYGDFAAELEFDLPAGRSGQTGPAEEGGGMRCAGGIILRQVTDDTFYYFLVGDTGMFRFDFVFNGHPRVLVPWTAAGNSGGTFTLKLIARGTSFTFFVNGSWVGEIDDDGAESGSIALAAQRYHEGEPEGSLPVRFRRLMIESRPLETEIEYIRWTRAIPPSPERRIVFARRLFGFGNYGPALVQLRKAFTSRPPDPRERLFVAECSLRLGFHESALEQFEAAAAELPELEEARTGKANVLYLQNRFGELVEYLESLEEPLRGRPVLLNLRGNALSALGRFSEAARACRAAFEADPETAVYGLNAASALLSAGGPGAEREAAELYRECARTFFRRQELEDLETALSALRRIEPSDPAAAAIEGKMAFQDGEFERAGELLRPLAEAGCEDSAVHYLCALLDLRAGNLEAALAGSEKACRLEPGYPLYRFKHAEILYLLGRGDPEQARAAAQMDEENGWAWNLLGLLLLDRNGEAGRDAVEALDALEKAVGLLPDEPEPLINRSEALLRLRGTTAALESLDAGSFRDGEGKTVSAVILNRRGNLLSREERFGEASDAYLAAAALEPREPLWRENAAAALLEADRVPEADRLLARLLEEEPTAARYRLTGRSALRTGEYARAEAAFNAAVQADPEDPASRIDMARLLMLRERFAGADEALSEAERLLEDAAPSPLKEQALRLRERLRESGGTVYRCASCGRSWWAPKDAAAPERLLLKGEPPAEAPAGGCSGCGAVYCVACAMETLSGGRFHCPACALPLKLNDPGLRAVMMKVLERERGQA